MKNFQIDLFNSLSNEIKELPFKEFKMRLREILLKNAFFSFDEFRDFFNKGF